ncbi:hypothetical protein FisN_1Hh493 [Fistulifera solaris]|uniref:Mitochondrial splicing suppressor 51-like C-terminal domain-containing protein n=1 Tax=Fistulifera solaris TaxID=1519565 RepID=A0A1Z5JJV7_FISSO|nr:hypothetical protein FisN_1Hh493 [Fistulifera solaris]|eukprot:GAX14297.1 hypothetical protein FisN_1Hh493 [Fistulifera solaris]
MKDVEREGDGEPWVSGEGYSPLVGSDFSMMAISYGDDDSSDCGQNVDETEKGFVKVNDDVVINQLRVGGSRDDNELLTRNYETLAEQALAALEADYLATIRLEEGHRNGKVTEKETDTSCAQFLQPSMTERLFEETESPSEKVSPAVFATPDLFPKEAKLRETSVDLEKVRKAVESIEIKNPSLKANFETWDLDQKEKVARASISRKSHVLIPDGPRRAFLKETTKAKQITHTLSRSATIAEALVRLNVIGAKVFEDTWCLNVHVIGCDQVECETDDRIRTYFQPLVRWIGAQHRGPTSIHLSLVGPGIVERDGSASVNLLSGSNSDRLQIAHASCHSALYKEWLSSETDKPDIIIAFNAGIWGYSDWCATIRIIAERKLQVPFVVTAYTLQEADDDYDVLEEGIIKALACSKEKIDLCCIWEPEINPFASKMDRPTQSAPAGRRYRENQAWQAWRL